MFRTSLQTITWGDPQHHLFDHIFGLADATGFDGVEIGFRRLGQIGIDAARALFDRHQVVLNAVHVGGNLADLAQAADERAAVDQIAAYLTALDCGFLIYSGLNTGDDAALATGISRLRAMADTCAGRGIRLLYHNHDWEFRNDRRIWNRLRDAAIPGLGFAPDLGWAVKGGQGMGALLDEIGSEVEILHFKDFVSWQDGQNTCHLGDGVVDFQPAWDWLARNPHRDLWLTAEQDNARDNDIACRVNAAYLSARLAGLAS